MDKYYIVEIGKNDEWDEVSVYVTGLTPATVAVVKAAALLDRALTLYHYNRDTNGYEAQVVL